MEIVVRAVVIFAFLWLITRAVGRSTLGELSTFELLLYVTMGDLVQQAITQQDASMTAGVLAVSTFALLTVGLSWLQWRWPRTRDVITGRPLMIFHDGAPVEAAMRSHRLSVEDFLVAAREQGISSTRDIDCAILEADGRISFFTRDGQSQGSPEPPPEG
jgi:uncharacterized membrane protein YcaP (DUF421 family)